MLRGSVAFALTGIGALVVHYSGMGVGFSTVLGVVVGALVAMILLGGGKNV